MSVDERKYLTVAELFAALRKLMDNGHGDYPVFVCYESVYGEADGCEVVTRGRGKGVYIGNVQGKE